MIGRDVGEARIDPAKGLFAPSRGTGGRLKRSFDILFSLALILLALPVFLIVPLMILVTDRAPVLFRHERVGRDGRPFACLKFRTMRREADEILARHLAECPAAMREWAEARKLRADPRILGAVGRFLRRTSLDELPQVFNVLRGDMSVVGPRPVVRDELQRYGVHAPLYLSVRPGLTGPWQVGGRNDTSYEQRVSMDADYVRSWSFVEDIRIVLRTAMMMLSGRGAY
ncbi:sugar transferase (plasmid) [Paroceanicella profunda]|uniref:Sugar transferase n=1 Tax=Paroceanicella profunda TaxID=2579971 RepID=A0A5B8FJC6_9RHOB|nr:sugar transferase [Paroceanicella profunda]QDL94731.1 sugar transferase [Paroceanicella profunda]